MQIVFLGTGSQYPSKERGVSCIALRFDDGEVWLFDCGEGSQIQLQKSNVKASRISKIFITHLHGDHLFGLPGLLCSIGSWNPDKKDVIELYGPSGLRKYVQTNLLLSHSLFDNLRFVIHEFVISEENSTEEWKQWVCEIEKSAVCQHPSEICGSNILPDSAGIYNCFESCTASVKAGFIKHRVPSFGFVIEECSSPGRLDADKLARLGISPGPLYGQLKSGKCVIAPDGKTINPSEVVGSSIPGRKITILGDTCDSDNLSGIAYGSDILIHEATLQNSLKEKAVKNGHSTPEMAAAFANAIGAKTLVLTHFSQRYAKITEHLCNSVQEDCHMESESVAVLLEEAEATACDKLTVMLAEDLLEINVSRQIPTEK